MQLIDARGCPVDLYVFPELHKTPDGALEAEFYAFKIPDSTFLVFQATVRTCRGPCEPVSRLPSLARSPPSSAGHLQRPQGRRQSRRRRRPLPVVGQTQAASRGQRRGTGARAAASVRESRRSGDDGGDAPGAGGRGLRLAGCVLRPRGGSRRPVQRPAGDGSRGCQALSSTSRPLIHSTASASTLSKEGKREGEPRSPRDETERERERLTQGNKGRNKKQNRGCNAIFINQSINHSKNQIKRIKLR